MSKAASQRRWLSKEAIKDCFCGPENVERVQKRCSMVSQEDKLRLKPLLSWCKQHKHINGALGIVKKWFKRGRKQEAKELLTWALKQNLKPQWGATQTACNSVGVIFSQTNEVFSSP